LDVDGGGTRFDRVGRKRSSPANYSTVRTTMNIALIAAAPSCRCDISGRSSIFRLLKAINLLHRNERATSPLQSRFELRDFP
jgi:hypothetical protein